MRILSVLFLLLALSLPAFANEELEKQMLELVNAERVKAGLKPYILEPALVPVARAHSTDMIKNRFFDHKSPTTGFVEDRIFAVKYRMVGAGENIAANNTLQGAHGGLMNSPGHKANILHKDFTHCAIGVVKTTKDIVFVTQIFTLPAPAVDVKALPKDILDGLNKRRADKGLPPLKLNEVISKAAAENAAGLAKAGKGEKADFLPAVKAAGIPCRQLLSSFMMTWTPGELAENEIFLTIPAGEIGLGFAENTEHKNLGYGAIWSVIVIVAQ